ncbi:MAG: Hsp20/alpha crystallin family protein, partial [Deltaproteobacteria bacterium]|nr:Hsp20/alpha crystallin family protein [Deltaproteobacteria bacterium]
MKAIRKWSPFSELATLHEEMDEFFRKTIGAMGGLTHGFWGGEAWYPTVESFVKEGNLVVRCEVPGMDPKDIDISIVGNTLTIKGERKAS